MQKWRSSARMVPKIMLRKMVPMEIKMVIRRPFIINRKLAFVKIRLNPSAIYATSFRFLGTGSRLARASRYRASRARGKQITKYSSAQEKYAWAK